MMDASDTPISPAGPGARRRRLGVFAWCSYDFAHSAFGTIVTTFIFAPYFISAVAPSPTEGTVMWGHTTSIAALCVAVLSPALGAIADRGGRRKPWIATFTSLCAVLACALYFIEPSTDFVWPALILFAMALIASDLAWVFYNSMLPTLIARERVGRISGWAWSLGYFGGMASLVLALVFFVREDAPLKALDSGALESVRATAILAGLWFALFALPLYFLTPDTPKLPMSVGAAVTSGLKDLAATLRHARRHANIAFLLLSWLFSSNGLATLFAFAGIYAAGTFGMSLSEVTLLAIGVNVTAGIGAAIFGWVDDWLGPKKTILAALLALFVLGTILVLTEEKAVLWAGGLALGVFIGPAQSASRSFMARLAPPGMEAQIFGLYALSGRVTGFIGPAVLAFVTAAFDSQRAGMASILVFFVLGMVTLLFVREPAKEGAA
ncbi:MFS transporter [Afifella pfennigii]|uniref:MFS transporter n=1 Tax=Afifella pfennigii TaxID=209897 RepID=UPI0006917DEC|nr:MFS transporter [Afifella pfennigii]